MQIKTSSNHIKIFQTKVIPNIFSNNNSLEINSIEHHGLNKCIAKVSTLKNKTKNNIVIIKASEQEDLYENHISIYNFESSNHLAAFIENMSKEDLESWKITPTIYDSRQHQSYV